MNEQIICMHMYTHSQTYTHIYNVGINLNIEVKYLEKIKTF